MAFLQWTDPAPMRGERLEVGVGPLDSTCSSALLGVSESPSSERRDLLWGAHLQVRSVASRVQAAELGLA